VTLIFDLVPGAGRALGAAMKRFTGGRGFERDQRTRADVLAALRAAGFAQAEAFDTRAVARARDLPYPDAATRMVVFRATTSTRS
jgi:hypothetical protein